jgi:hypothetical protein
MSGMTGDERDRILVLLSAGPATVARLAAGLGLPGGVVSYQLKLLEREGLARVGTIRGESGLTTPVWVSTAAAAPPLLRIPAPLPGLTWTGDEPYPAPVWTAPQPPTAAAAGTEPESGGDGDRRTRPAPADAVSGRATGEPSPDATSQTTRAGSGTGASRADAASSRTGAGQPDAAGSGPGRSRSDAASSGTGTSRPGAAVSGGGEGWSAGVTWTGERGAAPTRFAAPPSLAPAPQPRRPVQADADRARSPRLVDVRRVPVDDATFYEFASRLDALAREFAARATPGAPQTELTIVLSRPDGDGTAGYGS